MANKITDHSRKNRKAAGATRREHSREAEREALAAWRAEQPQAAAEADAAMGRMLAMFRGRAQS